jgi:outer membrane OprD family porin
MNIIKYIRVILIFFIVTFCLFGYQKSIATQPDYLLEEQSPPDSANEIKGPLTASFQDEKPRWRLFPELKDKLQNLHPFLRDTEFGINFRSVDFKRDRSGIFDPDGSSDIRAWAVGGSLDYQSGLLFDRLSLGASYYTSQKIVGPKNEDGSLLLEPEQKGFGVLGQANVSLQITNDIEFKGYRQTFSLPYLNKRDSRMVPNTHEAYIIEGLNVSDKYSFITGYVHKMKTRASSKFIPMSEVAGFDGTNDGLAMAGILYQPNENFSIGVIDYYSLNFMNIFYTETNKVFQLTDKIPLHLSAQYTNQHSVGDEFDGEFNRHTGGMNASVSYRGVVLNVAGTITGNDSNVRSPFGGPPSYLSIIVKNFFRAGEEAWLLGLSYDFSYLGIPGLTAYTNYAEGYTPDTGSIASPDQSEWDITIDYQPEFLSFKGLWFRYRRVEIDQDGPSARDQTDNRIILNWEIPLL